MSRVRVFCEPCFAAFPTCPTTIRFPAAGVLFVPCPECGCQFRLTVGASLWWELLLLKSSVMQELAFARAELDHVRTPADIGGGL